MRLAPVTSLNGAWQMQPEKAGLDAPKEKKWWDVHVPMPWSSFLVPASGVPLDQVPNRMAWFRRHIIVPEVPPLSRLVLHFDAVNFYAVVFVNGKRCGEHVGDAIPFDVDITDFVTPRRDARITVGVQDISHAQAEARHWAGRKLLYPGLSHHPGIWGDVSLRIVPQLHIVGLAFRTTLSKHGKTGPQGGRVRVSVAVQNGTGRPLGFSLTNEIYDGARQAVAFAPIRGTVGAGERTEIEMGTSWDSAALWWPDQPHLYTLRSALWSALPSGPPGGDAPPAAGDVVDRVHTRVGFREFRVDADAFRLNDVPIQLRSESVCPISGQTVGEMGPAAAVAPVEREQARELLAALKDKRGINAVRFHRMPPSAALLEAADDVGLLAIVEFPLPDDEQRYAVHDPRFWTNAQALARQWVETRAHHPSVIMWSIDQGMVRRYGTGAADSLDSLTHFVAEIDPTRPVENSGDADLADTSGLLENTPLSVFFPQTGVAFRPAGPYEPEGVRGRVMPLPRPPSSPWLPARRDDRPLCIMDHTRRALTSNSLAFFLGDPAYGPGIDLARAAAPLAILEMAACRMAKLAAINTVGRALPPPGTADAVSEVAVLPNELFANFYAGTRLVENLAVRNDTRFDQDCALAFRFASADGNSSEHNEEMLLEAGSQREEAVAFELPDIREVHEAATAVSTLAELTVTLTGTRSGSFEHRRKVAIWPRVRSEGARRIGLYDPDGRTAAALSAVGAKYSAAHGSPHGEFDTIIVGENALDRGSAPDIEAVRAFVAEGGLAICLAQSRIPYDISPVTMVLDEERPAAITFVRDGDHPVLRGLSTFEMRWWQDDHRVASSCFRKPASGNFRCLVDAGGPGGLRWAAAVEVCHGRGSCIFSQMELVGRAARAPIAGLLLARLADAAPSWQPAEARILAGGASFSKAGVACPELSQDFAAGALEAVAVVMLTAADLERLSARQLGALRDWAHAGGCLYLHNLAPDHAQALADVSSCDVELIESPQGRLVLDRPGFGLARGLSSADLHFPDHGARYFGQTIRQVHAADTIIRAKGQVTGIAATIESSSEYGLAELQAGEGRVVVDQVRWDVETQADSRAGRYISTLLTNLGVPLEPRAGAAPSAECLIADMSAACNSSLIDYIPGDGEGWTGRGPDSDLSAFSPGLLLAAGLPFRVAADDRNCCVLGPDSARAAEPIPINRRARSVAFLIACEGHARQGLPVAHLTVRREDNLETQIPVRFGIDVLDWNERPRDLEDASVAWKGFTLLGEPAVIYAKKWENNRPDIPVTSLVFSSTRAGATPILLAVTALV